MSQQIATLSEAFGTAGVPSLVARTFALVEVAEQEIAAAKKRWPKKAKAFDAAFLDLCPEQPMIEFGELLYRAYVQERLKQIEAGQGRSATNAEIAMTISRLSNLTPIHWEYTAAYWLAMCAMFGEKKMLGLTGEKEEHVYTVNQFKEAQECLLGVKNDINRRIKNEEAKSHKAQVPKTTHRRQRVLEGGRRSGHPVRAAEAGTGHPGDQRDLIPVRGYRQSGQAGQRDVRGRWSLAALGPEDGQEY
jgi:hypothetical protein